MLLLRTSGLSKISLTNNRTSFHAIYKDFFILAKGGGWHAAHDVDYAECGSGFILHFSRKMAAALSATTRTTTTRTTTTTTMLLSKVLCSGSYA
jgi:hypothetical protein